MTDPIKPGDDVTLRGLVIDRVGDHVQIAGGYGLDAWELTVNVRDLVSPISGATVRITGLAYDAETRKVERVTGTAFVSPVPRVGE